MKLCLRQEKKKMHKISQEVLDKECVVSFYLYSVTPSFNLPSACRPKIKILNYIHYYISYI